METLPVLLVAALLEANPAIPLEINDLEPKYKEQRLEMLIGEAAPSAPSMVDPANNLTLV